MPFKYLGHQGDASLRRHIRESDQSRVRYRMHINEFPEVGIDCHQDSAFGGGTFE